MAYSSSRPSRTVRAWCCSLLAAIALLSGGPAHAGEPAFFRIGTGGAAGTYFPIGTLIAESVSGASDTPACGSVETCGVPGLVAVAQISNGSVANVQAIGAGALEAALVQSDVAFWAYSGTGVFAGKEKIVNLRFVANLYPESMHLVVRRGSGIRTVADLRNRRVSLDEPGSGTLVNARSVLAAYGLSERDLRAEYVKPDLAVERMRAERLDGFFIVAGWPTRAVSEFAASGRIGLVPIADAAVAAVRRTSPFFSPGLIPASAYPGIPETPTLDVGAQLIVSAALSDALVYNFTRALWSARSTQRLRQGHPRGGMIKRETALVGAGIPLHPGAERYYREVGLLR